MEKKKENISYPSLNNLLLSILGTAIGVGLTFFVNNMVENNHQKAAQRETAIMAVCDIDEIVQELKEEIHLEDSLFKVAMYVLTHQEQINSLPMDTLDMAFKYLYDDPTVVKKWTADTKENAFNSGIDARMNLGNNHFYDNVQSCYYVRRMLMKVIENSPAFCRPVSIEMYEHFLQQMKPTDISYDGVPFPEAQRSVMKHIVALESTTLYIKRYFPRRSAYQDAINKLEDLNRENKLMMDISDKEIEAYIKKNSNHVSRQAITDLILGAWEYNTNDTQNTYVFYEDSVFEYTFSMETEMQIQLEDEQKEIFVLAPTTQRVKGRWELNGDTLTNDFDFSTAEILSFDFDTSSFPQSFLESNKDSLEMQKNMAKDYLLEMFRQQVLKEIYIVSFDKSANTMVWTKEETTPAGNKQTSSIQFYRKPE